MPDVPQQILDDPSPWYVKLLPGLIQTIFSNPLTVVTLASVGTVLYQQIKGNELIVATMREAYESMESRREKREEANQVRATASLDRLTAALERNTDAIYRGGVNLKSTSHKQEP